MINNTKSTLRPCSIWQGFNYNIKEEWCFVRKIRKNIFINSFDFFINKFVEYNKSICL